MSSSPTIAESYVVTGKRLEAVRIEARHSNLPTIVMLHVLIESRSGRGLQTPQLDCSKFVVVIGSEPDRSNRNDSRVSRCRSLESMVVSRIFKTDENDPLFYESAALTS